MSADMCQNKSQDALDWLDKKNEVHNTINSGLLSDFEGVTISQRELLFDCYKSRVALRRASTAYTFLSQKKASDWLETVAFIIQLYNGGRVKRSELQFITRHHIIRITVTIGEQRDMECVATLNRRKISATWGEVELVDHGYVQSFLPEGQKHQ